MKLGRSQQTGEPLGFAILEFKQEETTKAVLRKKHYIHGRELDVKPYAQSASISRQQEASLKKKIFLKSLPLGADKLALHKELSQFGEIDKAFIMYNHRTGLSRGFGFVEFREESSVAKALETPVFLMGKKITVSKAVQKDKSGLKEKDQKKITKACPAKKKKESFNTQAETQCKKSTISQSNLSHTEGASSTEGAVLGQEQRLMPVKLISESETLCPGNLQLLLADWKTRRTFLSSSKPHHLARPECLRFNPCMAGRPGSRHPRPFEGSF